MAEQKMIEPVQWSTDIKDTNLHIIKKNGIIYVTGYIEYVKEDSSLKDNLKIGQLAKRFLPFVDIVEIVPRKGKLGTVRFRINGKGELLTKPKHSVRINISYPCVAQEDGVYAVKK
eukprot:384538_1